MDSDPDENCEIACLVRDVVDDPTRWMDTPNDQLGGASPTSFSAQIRNASLRIS
jgi:hypothetical protein